MTFRNGILSLAKTISNDYASSWHIGVWFVVPFCATGYMAQTWLGFSFYQAFLCALLMAVVVLVVKAASFLRAASGHAPIQANSARTFGSQGAFSTPTEERQVTLLDGHQMQSAGLLLFSTPAGEQQVALGENHIFVIGAGANDDVLIVDPTVSPAHCEIFLIAGKVYVGDHSSANGTFVDGRRIRPGERVPLDRGALISLGEAAWVRFEQLKPG